MYKVAVSAAPVSGAAHKNCGLSVFFDGAAKAAGFDMLDLDGLASDAQAINQAHMHVARV